MPMEGRTSEALRRKTVTVSGSGTKVTVTASLQTTQGSVPPDGPKISTITGTHQTKIAGHSHRPEQGCKTGQKASRALFGRMIAWQREMCEIKRWFPSQRGRHYERVDGRLCYGHYDVVWYERRTCFHNKSTVNDLA